MRRIALGEANMNLHCFSYNSQKNNIKIGPLEPKIQPFKGCDESLRWAYDDDSNNDIIGLLPVTCHLSQFLFVFDCGSTSVRHTRNFRRSIS